jgi:hypothetical protein
MAVTFNREQQLPEILRAYPQVREVFDRYGLKGCGGAHGPAESIEFFARSHGVDEQRLLNELAEAARKPASGAAPARASLADGIYKPFFIAGMAVFVLAGLVIGTLMLFWMSGDASFFAPGIRRINAHANAMVYGFAGMFILGFGYQALPRFRHTQLWKPGLALLSFFLLLGGVALRFFGEFFGQQGIYEPALASGAFVAGAAGTLMQAGAFVLFGLILWKTLPVDGKLRVYERFVMASAVWFIVSAVFSLVLYVQINSAADFGAMVAAVAIYQEPLRIVQMYGAIGLVILGVMLRFLPAVFGFRDPGDALFRRMFWVINGGILLAAIAFPISIAAKRAMMDPALVSSARGFYALGAILMAGGYIWLIAAFAPWRRARVKDRSIKFVRVAHAWLVVSLLMLLLEPLYIAYMGSFGHGYHAGMRHAFTIGFITMMIVAVSIKVVPNLNGVDPSRLKPLWAVFALLNVSLIWRVIGEVAGDFNPSLLAGLHFSGVMAGAALLLWAGHLLRVMYFARVSSAEKVSDITPETRVASVVETWPKTMEVFQRHGFTLLSNPVARRTIARAVSLEHVCKMQGKDVTQFVHELRVAAGLTCVCASTAEKHEPRLDPQLTVAEAARKHPATVPVFAKLGMDACCGGEDSIENAAAHGGLELGDVMHQLEHAIQEDAK